MRGIAALTVVAYHVHGQFSDTPSTGWDTAAFAVLNGFSNGIGAVVAFFVISGFVLARSLEANPDPLRFFRNRLFRLFPAAVALLTALHQWFGIYVMYEGDFSPANVLLNMLLIRTDINAVMWSMKVECLATPLILFSVWLLQRNGAHWLWALIAVLFALSFWGPYVHVLGDASNLAPFYAFVFGVLAQRYGQRVAAFWPGAACLSCYSFLLLRHSQANRANPVARMPRRNVAGCAYRLAIGRVLQAARFPPRQILWANIVQFLFAACPGHCVCFQGLG